MLIDQAKPLIALGFDYGEKKIGVAIGNNYTNLARSLTTIENRSRIWVLTVIQRLVSTWNPDVMVVGLPIHADGREQELTRLSKKFERQLYERFHLPVIAIDERYSSLEAKLAIAQHCRQDISIDAEAAKIILQQYFNEMFV